MEILGDRVYWRALQDAVRVSPEGIFISSSKIPSLLNILLHKELMLDSMTSDETLISEYVRTKAAQKALFHLRVFLDLRASLGGEWGLGIEGRLPPFKHKKTRREMSFIPLDWEHRSFWGCVSKIYPKLRIHYHGMCLHDLRGVPYYLSEHALERFLARRRSLSFNVNPFSEIANLFCSMQLELSQEYLSSRKHCWRAPVVRKPNIVKTLYARSMPYTGDFYEE